MADKQVTEYSAKDTFPASVPVSGTVSVGSRKDLIKGTSTAFLTDYQTGDYIYDPTNDLLVQVDNIVSDTEMYLKEEIGTLHVATVTVTGTSGAGTITITGTGTAYTMTFDTDLSTTATNFFNTHGADIYKDEGILVTVSGSVLTFTGTKAGISFTAVSANTSGDLNGTDATVTTAATLSSSIVRKTPRNPYTFISVCPKGDVCDINGIEHAVDEAVTWARQKGQKRPEPVIVDPSGTADISFML